MKKQIISCDCTITEIQEGQSRVKVIAVVLAIQDGLLIIGDKSGELLVHISNDVSLNVKQKGRFLMNISKHEDRIRADLLSFLPMTNHQISQYSRMCQLEKRIPK